MVRMVKGTPNYEGLIELLGKHGIDANDVEIEGVGPDGFNEVQRHRDGRPHYKPGTFERLVARKAWPSAEVFKRVWALYYNEEWVEGQSEPYVKPLVIPELVDEVPIKETPVEEAVKSEVKAKTAPKSAE